MLITDSVETYNTVSSAGEFAITVAGSATYSYLGTGTAFDMNSYVSFNLVGAVTSRTDGIDFQDNGYLRVATGGSLIANRTALHIAGSIANDGTIFGGQYGVYGSASGGLSLDNRGSVSGAYAAVTGLAGADTINNFGTISGLVTLGGGADKLSNAASGSIIGNVTTGSGSDTIVNAGTIQGAVTVNSTAADSVTLTNDGLISGNIFADAGRETVTNSGRITGTLSIGAGAGSITNSGEITGGVFAVGLSGLEKVSVLNTGHISGGITTGYAADSIDTHLGTVGGALTGGRGNDTYVIAGGETITEIAATTGGFDTVLSYGDYQLGAGLEALSLFGDARLGIGNALDNSLTANTLGSTLIGGAGQDTLFGGDGDDILRGGLGNDTIYEADGQNQIYGGFGDDKIYLTSGENSVSGGYGNDLLVAGAGIDYLSGDAGIDTVSYANSTSGVTVSLDAGAASGGYAEGDALYGVENLTGSAYADSLTGAAGANRLDGGAGADTLIGGDGDDVLTGGAAGDVINGGAGFDIADYSTAATAVVLNGATITGDIAGDSFNSIEGFQLSAFNDTFVAVYDLSLQIGGGAGNDTIVGKGAADRIDGDTGNDTLTGGGGADVFQFDRIFNFSTTIGWGQDTVTDFQDGTDKIDLSHAFGIDDFSDLTITGSRSGTLITFAGDSILLSNVASSSITAADFIFA